MTNQQETVPPRFTEGQAVRCIKPVDLGGVVVLHCGGHVERRYRDGECWGYDILHRLQYRHGPVAYYRYSASECDIEMEHT